MFEACRGKTKVAPCFSRVRVKFCGLTRPQDAAMAAMLGVDAIGLVFCPDSPRAVTVRQACEIIGELPPFVTVVGLFVNESRAKIRNTLASVPIDLLQFHGDEPPDECNQYQRPYIKAVRMCEDLDLPDFAARYQGARALLLDTYVQGIRGGTGKRFDWSLARVELGLPIILAGGLSPDNVGDAIRTVSPYGVDVSGGIEARKGIKDAAKMSAFMRGVYHVGF